MEICSGFVNNNLLCFKINVKSIKLPACIRNKICVKNYDMQTLLEIILIRGFLNYENG